MKANLQLSRNVQRLTVSPYSPESIYLRELAIYAKNVPYFSHAQNKQNSTSVKKNRPTERRPTRTVLDNNTQIFNSLIKAIGGPAIERDQHGYFCLKPRPWKAVVSSVLFIAIFLSTVFAAFQRVARIIEINQFDSVVVEIASIILLIPHIMSPVTLWKGTYERIAFVNRYIDLVTNFREVTEHDPVQRNGWGVLTIWIVFIIINTCLSLLIFLFDTRMVLWQIIPYFFNISLISLMVSIWTLTCEYLRLIGMSIAQNFKEKYSTNPGAQTVREFRKLWLELSSLCHDVGNAYCLMVGFIILVFIIVISLMMFGFLQNFPSLPSATIGVGLLYFFFLLFSIYNQPHRITDQVPRGMRDVLEVIRVSAVSREEYIEINRFVNALTTNSLTVSLGGFVDLNRRSFRTIVATLITYLVVLLQLSLSSQTKPKYMNLNQTTN